MMKKIKTESGFTLVEIAIVIVIIGLLTLPLFELYRQYLIERKMSLTQERITQSSAQISGFFNNALRYPCPSDRALPVDDPNYGREFAPGCDPATIGLSVGSCTPGGGVCLVPGARDANGDGDPDPVLIGGVPIRSSREVRNTGLSDNLTFDGWDSQLTYAVTLSLTSNATFSVRNGAIAAIDEFGQATAGINDDAHYALLSHGMDRRGGFSNAGVPIMPCAAVGAARDHENCNNTNGTFVQALGFYRANTPDYYDDIIIFSRSSNALLWSFIPTVTGISNHIYNLNAGNVGVNTDTPTERLHVDGTISTNNLTKTTQLCRNDGSDCFNINAITGSGTITCPSGEAMTGVDQSTAQCNVPVFSTVQPNIDCSPGWVMGIRTNGEVICTP